MSSDESTTDELVGRTMGGYKLLESVGSGSLAVVYKAHQPNLDRWVAVKVLYLKERISLARFQREARAIAQLRHRNILTVNEYGEDDEWPYLVMEYVEGGTLKDRLRRERLTWMQAVNLIIPIADALRYAHSRGIVHRDLKPTNILMPRADWPLLADFGMIKLIDADESLTRTGAVIGTPSYIAPEQARGVEIDYRVDIYALGVILFEMVAGRLPFDYENINRVLLAHIADPPPLPRTFNPDCPPELEQVILMALQKAPEDRHPDMASLINALKDVLASSDERPALYSVEPPSSLQTLLKSDPEMREKVSRAAAEKSLPSTKPTLGTRIFVPEQRATLHIPHQDTVIIGRTHRDIVVDVDLGPYGAAKAGISRRHARLFRQSSEWLIDDMGSLNGTYVNNVKITPGSPVPLRDGDSVRCSHLSFIFLTANEEAKSK